MSFDSNIIISSTFGDYTRSFLSGSETATYYIHDYENQNIDIAYGEANTAGHDSDTENYIRSIFRNLDPLISLDFTEVFNANEATFRIYSVIDFSKWDDATFGEVTNNTNYWDILWRRSDSDTEFNQNTIIHEIGHSLGLSHPNEDPTNILWDTDITVMSYNKGIDGWNTSFSSNDFQALRMIWGSEEDGLPPNIPIANNQEIENPISPIDDFSQDRNTVGSIEKGENINGSIESIGDRDWFSLDLTAGEILQLQLTGRSSTSKICPCFSCNQKYNNSYSKNRENSNEDNNLFLNSSLRDPFLRLYNEYGELLYSDDDSGVDLNSLIQFKAEYSGKYFASASAYSDNDKGDYTLSLTLDDYAGDLSSTGIVNYGEQISGNIEVARDIDWFSLHTREGDEIQIDLIGNTLSDPYLVLYDQNGELVASNDDFSPDNLNSRITFNSTYSGNFFISVEGSIDRHYGTYLLSVDLLSSSSDDINANDETENDSETVLDSNNLNLSDLEALNYLASNDDLIEVFGMNLEAAKDHYKNNGYFEGRSINDFNVVNYLNNYNDLSNALGDDHEEAIRHYIMNGYREGRTYTNLSNIEIMGSSFYNIKHIENFSLNTIVNEKKILNTPLKSFNLERHNTFDFNSNEAWKFENKFNVINDNEYLKFINFF